MDPASERGGTPVNALGEEDASGYVPTYNAAFPEYYGTAIQTESSLFDMGPLNRAFYGETHGRYARGASDPVWVWLTEMNMGPNEFGVTGPAALELKGKITGRILTFFSNKGAQRLDLFAAAQPDDGFGVVRENLIQYSKTNATYPTDDAPYLSPALRTTQRIVDRMKAGMDNNLTLQTTRKITVTRISDAHDHRQFDGDGTQAHPPLYNRELLAILPFQVNASKFVIPFYVMTRDVRASLPAEAYTVELRGLKGHLARVSCYDPISDTAQPVTVAGRGTNSLKFVVQATDAPRLLIVEEGGEGGVGRPTRKRVPCAPVVDECGKRHKRRRPDEQLSLSERADGPQRADDPEAPSNPANEDGQRLRGCVPSPATGNHTFWIASDDASELWLSTGELPANTPAIAWHLMRRSRSARPDDVRVAGSSGNGFTPALQAQRRCDIERGTSKTRPHGSA